jgi:hypothetical protein
MTRLSCGPCAAATTMANERLMMSDASSSLGKLRRVSTYVQHVCGIIGHVTVEAGSTVGTDGTVL